MFLIDIRVTYYHTKILIWWSSILIILELHKAYYLSEIDVNGISTHNKCIFALQTVGLYSHDLE